MNNNIAGIILASVAIAATAAAPRQPCPAEFVLGQTYHEVQIGPCPTIDSVDTFRSADSLHVGYLCRERQTMVVGNRATGKTDAFFLYAGN